MSSQAVSVDGSEMPEVEQTPIAANQSGRRQRAVGDVPRAPKDKAQAELEVPIDLSSPQTVAAEQDIDSLRREGLTGRQLRMARRIAQKHGLAVTSDFDAVRQLRARGIDPFKRSNVLELVVPTDEASVPVAEGAKAEAANRVQLPQTMKLGKANLPSTERMAPADRRANEIMQIQRDMAKRRRKKSVMLLTRLAFFVMIPTILVGYYFNFVATPMYATKSEFVIQQA
jgi:capsular polysaccharide transport system permease protein